MRKIVVDGAAYSFSIGKDNCVIEHNGKRTCVTISELTALDYERGRWKKTTDGMITPKMVADYILRKKSSL